MPSGSSHFATARVTAWPTSSLVPGWALCALTITGQPAANADATSPPATEYASGKFVALNTTTGAGAELRLSLGGVWTVDKIAAASTNFAVGGKVYARATGSAGRYKVLGVATGSVMGTAFVAAVTGDTTAKVKLIPNAV